MTDLPVVIIRNAFHYDFGGGERFPVFLGDVLQEQKLRPIIISRSPRLLDFARSHNLRTIKGWWWSRQNWSGKRSVLFPVYVGWQLVLTLYYLLLFLRLQPKVVHIQSKDDFIAATIAGRCIGARVIWTDHADLKHIWRNHHVWFKNPVGKLVYAAARMTHAITFVSQSEQQLASQQLGNHSLGHTFKVIYNGVIDTAERYPAPHASKEIRFVSASRLVQDKGIGEMIDAFAQVQRQHPHISLTLIGDGPDEARFRAQAKHLGGITFLGYQKNPLTTIAASDIYLHATYHEGFSVSLVEASMLGKPIIATAIGGNLEIISNQQTGLLIPAKDTQALAHAMLTLVNNRSLRHALGKNARQQFLKRFQFEQIVREQFIPLYKEKS